MTDYFQYNPDQFLHDMSWNQLNNVYRNLKNDSDFKSRVAVVLSAKQWSFQYDLQKQLESIEKDSK